MKILNIIKKIITLDTSSIESYFDRYDNIVDVTIRRIDNFLYHRDNNYFCYDSESIEEREHAFVDSPEDERDKAHLILLVRLVLSYLSDDIQCGLTILQDLLLHAPTTKQKRKVMFTLALGYYRIGNFSKSLDYVSRCLEIKPQWSRAIAFKKDIYGVIQKERRRNLLLASSMAIGLVTDLLGYNALLFYPTWVMEALTLFLTDKGAKKVLTGSNPLEMHEEMYLLAHRYFIRGRFEDMPRCNYLIDRCLEIVPEWKPAMTLKRRMKFASMKAYIDEKLFKGIPYGGGVIMAVLIIRWAGI